MAHIAPYVVNSSSAGLQGISLGFHAYSLRIDNLSNQWLQEVSSLAWIPPYSLGVVLKLYGTSVALLLIRAPTGQPQLQPVFGEYAVAMYSDETRAEVAGVPVREFTLVQAVSDLSQGPMPAFPPNGVSRLWADTFGNIHYLLPTGADAQLVDTKLALGGILSGTLPNAQSNPSAAPTWTRLNFPSGAYIRDYGPNPVGGVNYVELDALTVSGPSALSALNVNAGNLNLAAGVNINGGSLGGALAGALPNPTLATLSKVRLLSLFQQGLGGYSTTAVGVWQPTPVGVNATIAGNKTLLIPWQVTMYDSATGNSVYVGILLNGTVTWTVGIWTWPGVNYVQQVSGTLMLQPNAVAAGTQNFQIGLLQSGAGTLSIHSGANSSIGVFELND